MYCEERLDNIRILGITMKESAAEASNPFYHAMRERERYDQKVIAFFDEMNGV